MASDLPNKIPVSIRLEPWLKQAAEQVARRENRSLTNLIETLLLERCKRHGVKIQEKPSDSSHA